MIKKKKQTVKKKTLAQVIGEYLRTIGFSFLVALFFTILLSAHARNEMIKNLYKFANERLQMEEEMARQLVAQPEFAKDLKKKSYMVCMHVGDLYATAQEYEKAQLAYELALEKSSRKGYTIYYKITNVLIAQGKFNEAKTILESIKDKKDKDMVKFKTRSYYDMGDKYYSMGKFLSAAKSYEKSKFYYDKFSKKDKKLEKSIKNRIVKSYIEVADIMVRSGLNSDAVRFLNKAAEYSPNNFTIKYKLAIIYSDLDPVKSVEIFEPLINERPQEIDYGIYSKTLMKAANIKEWEGKPTEAKKYRYKMHSADAFIDRKVVYKNDIDVFLEKFIVKKIWLQYKIKASYKMRNVSHLNITNLTADFVLKHNDNVVETVTVKCADKQNVLFSNGGEVKNINVVFGKNIFTKKELEQYSIDIYLYKDSKYKTLISTMQVPLKTLTSDDMFSKEGLEQRLKEFSYNLPGDD